MYDDLIRALRALEEQVQEIQFCKKHGLPIDQDKFSKLVKDSEAIHKMTLDMLPKANPNPKPKKRKRGGQTFLEKNGHVKVIHVDEKTSQVITINLKEGYGRYHELTKFDTEAEAEEGADQLVERLRAEGFK